MTLRPILPQIFPSRSLAHVYAAWKKKRYYDLYQQMRVDVQIKRCVKHGNPPTSYKSNPIRTGLALDLQRESGQ